ncbi:HesB/IscA family protein [Fimbriiglobus ruber]|uniref:Putative iron binding protein from the HesB_IscA_SufA family n=1 Tax=Fimbriiglobus ruber TaxID=1908690 RepID=A0A225DG98_9BACT|nr:iron-sulfur cluster assembly accessory protein [Fimbriiglobus ruber]OWK40502.1 putative iron binding protein from the HesB_IscA_SufA family [Fimbriiglobus ruber]
MSTATTEQPTLGLKTEAPKTTPNVIITPKAAAEVLRIIASQEAEGVKETLRLRVRVVGGGCSGMEHKLDLDPTLNEKLDEVYELTGIPVVIDKRSMLYLNGATVDFLDDLNKRGFSIKNPNAKSTCGCGSSFSM